MLTFLRAIFSAKTPGLFMLLIYPLFVRSQVSNDQATTLTTEVSVRNTVLNLDTSPLAHGHL